MDIFKTLSNHNTSLVLETGGIIAGIDMDTYYQVTHLLIPQQTAASDRWMVHDERQLTNYFVNNEDLIMLGLIHTHPNMTSFLSSVDLHALYDYAKDNHSLVSIVLAPERDTAPAYCLTSRGFNKLASCKETGFHTHSGCEQTFYREAQHVLDDLSCRTSLIDFRMQ